LPLAFHLDDHLNSSIEHKPAVGRPVCCRFKWQNAAGARSPAHGSVMVLIFNAVQADGGALIVFYGNATGTKKTARNKYCGR
jgi:hypothetical protein